VVNGTQWVPATWTVFACLSILSRVASRTALAAPDGGVVE
jgi:hypothetical protein